MIPLYRVFRIIPEPADEPLSGSMGHPGRLNPSIFLIIARLDN
jgi:hypothetical protein